MTALFRVDTNSPYVSLAAARVDDVLGPGVRWQPIAFASCCVTSAGGRGRSTSRRAAGASPSAMRARPGAGLPPMTWPDGWPVDSYALEPLRASGRP